MPDAPKRTGPTLAEFLERAIHERNGRSSAMPLERVYSNGAMVIRRGKGCAIAIELTRKEGVWSGKQVVIRPLGPGSGTWVWPTQSPDQLVAEAVERVKRRERTNEEMQRRVSESQQFIEQLLATWKDRAAVRGNAEYAALAVAYCDEVKRGNSKATATLAEQLNISPAMMAQRIKEARRRLLLTAGEQGRASGAMTRLGVLYVDPAFPGLSQLRLEGKSVTTIARNYRLTEAEVAAALIAEGAGDLAGLSEGNED